MSSAEILPRVLSLEVFWFPDGMIYNRYRSKKICITIQNSMLTEKIQAKYKNANLLKQHIHVCI